MLNAVVVATADGEGTFVASLVQQRDADLEDGQLSDVDDQLTGLAGVGDTDLTAELEPVDVPGGALVKLADGEGIPVTGDGIKLGGFVEVELTFENADPVTMTIPVVANNRRLRGPGRHHADPDRAARGLQRRRPARGVSR